MKLISHKVNQASRVGVVVDDAVHAVLLDGTSWPGDLAGVMAASAGNPGRLAAGAAECALAEVRRQPPIPAPSKIIAAPVNYVDHQHEMNESAHIDALGVFLKAPSSLVADGGVVELPYDDRRFDQEGELALVIGRRARHVAVTEALDVVFGYTCLLDITMRGGEDRSTRKSFDTFTPMGPWLVTPDEIGDVSQLRLTCDVNGTPRQDADISDLLWSVPALVSYASSVMTLHPGDVITTGTPAGVGPINNGDDVCVTISRIGSLSVRVDASAAVHCPTRGADRGPTPPVEQAPVRERPAVAKMT